MSEQISGIHSARALDSLANSKCCWHAPAYDSQLDKEELNFLLTIESQEP